MGFLYTNTVDIKSKEQFFIQGISDRKSEAWKELYASYYTPLCRYAWRILDDREQATDIVQGVMIRLWENPPVFDAMTAFRLYLYRAVNNNCLQYIRNKNREDKRLQEWIFFTDELETESLSGMVTEELIRKLHLLLDTFPPKRKKVILMSMNKMTNEEISETLGVTIHTVKKHKKEAYAFIRKTLGSEFAVLLCLGII